MGRLRRRKRRYTWFPQIGFQSSNPEDDSVVLPVAVPNAPLSGLLSTPTIFPIIPDAPNEEPTAVTDHLDDFIASEYFLKRIVGRFVCAAPARTSVQTPYTIAYAIGAGFFIARADSPTSTKPIGSAAATDAKNNYGVLNVQNTREPWIWRRVWIMSPLVTASGFQVFDPNYPYYANNNLNGSVAEGSNIDARTARRVTQDDRLWFTVQTQVLNAGGSFEFEEQTFPEAYLDVRLLGALRKARNRSAF